MDDGKFYDKFDGKILLFLCLDEIPWMKKGSQKYKEYIFFQIS
jgi:hypothetical protein